MAGHSKWANIQHRKGRQDAKRGKVFTRLIKEITVAARLGGGDAGSNPRLRLALDKAREANLPKDTTQNAIGRGTGTLEGVNYEEIRYEGYGIGGAAIIVDCMTDNRTRTVAEVRHAFAKNGGNLGTDGSVAFLFKHCGQFLFAPGLSEDKVMEVALEGGAEDVIANEDGSIEVICLPSDFAQVDAALKKAGLKPEIAEIAMKPTLENALAGDDAVKMRKLLDGAEGNARLTIGPNVVRVDHGQVELVMRLIDGEFPNYDQVIPKSSKHTISVPKAEILSALRRVSVVASDRARGVKLHVSPGQLQVAANSPDFGEASEEIEIEYAGEEITVGFNSRYLLEVLGVLEDDQLVDISLSDDASPGVVRSRDDDSYRYVVMPMRL